MAKAEKRVRAPGDETRNMSVASILVVDASPESLAWIGETLEKEGLTSEKIRTTAEAVTRLKEKEFDVIIADMNVPEMMGVEFWKLAKALHPNTEVLLLSGDGLKERAADAMSLGAFDCLSGPLDVNRLTLSVERAMRKRAMRTGSMHPTDRTEKPSSFEDIVGQCEPMQEVFCLIRKVAPTTAPVIIQGESGTGKELVARAIHNNSRRRNQKLLVINSASLPETLLESELFGYRKGAFTGARSDKIGLLESAHRGTLFLDEVGSMSKRLQGKLLRAMQDGEILPVGSSDRIKIDVRLLAASNRDLRAMVESGEFRKDLYFRLNVIEITLAPLRGRKEDIPLLAEHFLQKYRREREATPKMLGKPAMTKLLKYRWPGNVRELENVIRRALIVSSGRVITASEIDLRKPVLPNVSRRPDLLSMSYREAKGIVQSEFQRAYLTSLLSECGGSVSKAASRAGLSRQAVHQMAKKHGLK